MKSEYETIIIGTGVAGYSAAMYAARLGLKVLLIGEAPGGTLALTGKVQNYPGFISIEGQKLTDLLEEHALNYKVNILTEIVERIEQEKNSFKVYAGKGVFCSETLILATGAETKKLNVPGEKEFFGNGVSYCALCDSEFIKGKEVGVAGGGDSAVKEALLASEYAKKVYIINNEEGIHPEDCNRKMLNKKIKGGEIEVINDNEILEIKGRKEVERLILKREFNGKKELPVQSLFVYIGQLPRSELAKMLKVKLNSKGEVITNQNCETNIRGFFAAGDVTNKDWKQAINAASQGVTAAYYAYNYCRNN